MLKVHRPRRYIESKERVRGQPCSCAVGKLEFGLGRCPCPDDILIVKDRALRSWLGWRRQIHRDGYDVYFLPHHCLRDVRGRSHPRRAEKAYPKNHATVTAA